LARAISFWEIPPDPINTPIVIKKGTAIRENELMPFTIRRLISFRLEPWKSIQKTEESPTAYAIGNRRKIIMKKLPRRIIIAILLASIKPSPLPSHRRTLYGYK
jgi:hypothetical protein